MHESIKNLVAGARHYCSRPGVEVTAVTSEARNPLDSRSVNIQEFASARYGDRYILTSRLMSNRVLLFDMCQQASTR